MCKKWKCFRGEFIWLQKHWKSPGVLVGKHTHTKKRCLGFVPYYHFFFLSSLLYFPLRSGGASWLVPLTAFWSAVPSVAAASRAEALPVDWEGFRSATANRTGEEEEEGEAVWAEAPPTAAHTWRNSFWSDSLWFWPAPPCLTRCRSGITHKNKIQQNLT